MLRKKYKYNFLKYRKNIYTCIFLFISAILLVSIYIFSLDFSLSTVSYIYTPRDLINLELKSVNSTHDIVMGKFISRNNYMGIIAIKIDYSKSITTNPTILMNLYENESKSAIFEGRHEKANIRQYEYYPIGFPLISDSKGKMYTFKFEVLHKHSPPHIKHVSQGPILIVKHQIPKSILLSKSNIVKEWFLLKINYALTDKNLLKIIITSLLPLFLYFLYLIVKHYFKKSPYINIILKYISRKNLLYISIISFIFFNILLPKGIFNQFSLFIIFIYVLLLIKYKQNYKFSFYLALLYLLMATFFIVINLEEAATKSALWIYYLLIVGTIHALISHQKL